MKEELVSLNVAKLAKENGFEELCYYYYDEHNKLQEPYLENGSSTDVEFKVNLTDLLENWNFKWNNTTSAPTQSLLQRWLREVHKIHLVCWLYDRQNKFYTEFGYQGESTTKVQGGDTTKLFDTYEQALEEGLKHCLHLIKN